MGGAARCIEKHRKLLLRFVAVRVPATMGALAHIDLHRLVVQLCHRLEGHRPTDNGSAGVVPFLRRSFASLRLGIARDGRGGDVRPKHRAGVVRIPREYRRPVVGPGQEEITVWLRV